MVLQGSSAAVHWCCSALVDWFALCLLGVLFLFDCCVAVVLLLCCCCVVVVVVVLFCCVVVPGACALASLLIRPFQT